MSLFKFKKAVAVVTTAFVVISGFGNCTYAKVGVAGDVTAAEIDSAVSNVGTVCVESDDAAACGDNVGTESADIQYVDVSDNVLASGGLLHDEPKSSLLKVSATQKEEITELILNAWDNCDASIDVQQYDISTDEFKELYYGLLNEHPSYFYVKSAYNTLGLEGIVYKVFIQYDYTQSEISSMKNAYEKAVDDIVKQADLSWNDLEKALFINDYLATHCEYDLTYSNYNSYNVFVENKAVCQGYSLAYKELADRLGIECTIVTSISLNHAWNLVGVNGRYYMVDTTYNDPTKDVVGRARHYFFMKSESFFNSSAGSHVATDYVTGNQVRPTVANDTSYDDYFWNSIDSAFAKSGNSWYSFYNKKLSEFTCDANGMTYVGNVDSKSYGSWNGYINIEKIGGFAGKVYVSKPTYIYSYEAKTHSVEDEYILDDTYSSQGYLIYGFSILPSGEVKADIRKSHSDSATIITAFTILASTQQKKSVTGCEIELTAGNYVYDGMAKTPSVTVKDGSATLIKDTDYFISYDNNVNAGEATVTISGKGDYTDIVTKTFTIKKAPQTFSATVNQSTLKKGETAKLTLNNPIGTVSRASSDEKVVTVNSDNEITAVGEGNATISLIASGNNNYEAAQVNVSITVTAPESSDNSGDVTGGDDNPGEVPGDDDNMGEDTKDDELGEDPDDGEEVQIKTLNLDDFSLDIYESTYIYTGKRIEIDFELTDNEYDYILEEDVDYVVEYINNVNVGTAIAVIKGIGDYDGTLNVKFKIKKAVNKLTVSTTSFTLNASAAKTQTIKISAKAKYGKISYKSDNSSVKVSSTGKVTIKKGFSGVAKITAKVTGNAGNYNLPYKVINVTVKPAKTSMTSVKSASSKKATIKWTRNITATGYEVQYGYKSSFSGATKKLIMSNKTVSLSAKKLKKGKKLYVRIRSYKTVKVNGKSKKLYSDWSSKKVVKVK